MTVRSLIPLVVGSLLLIVAAALYAFGYNALIENTAQADKLATTVATKTTQLERVTQAHAALDTLASDEDLLRQYSIGKDAIVPFLETLQTTGRSLGTKVEVLSVVDEKDGKHPRVALSLAVTGSFDAVMRTLGTIEYSPYDSVLRNLTLDSITVASGTPAWSASVVYSVGVSSSTPIKTP
jgi:hypothetical protein